MAYQLPGAMKAKNGRTVHRMRAQDRTGRPAQYFLMLYPEKEGAFTVALASPMELDLSEFGEVIASFYGDNPPDDVKKKLRDTYGLQIS